MASFFLAALHSVVPANQRPATADRHDVTDARPDGACMRDWMRTTPRRTSAAPIFLLFWLNNFRFESPIFVVMSFGWIDCARWSTWNYHAKLTRIVSCIYARRILPVLVAPTEYYPSSSVVRQWCNTITTTVGWLASSLNSWMSCLGYM